jgi:cation transport protein ChaC
MAVGRGTPDQPGLVLGLDRGGTCHGVAFRIDEQDIVTELPILWNREMLLGGYDPTWVDVIGDNGQTFASAIAFTIDRDHEHYANGLSHQERILRLANAVGSWGSSADYLFRTIYGLHSNGIRDEEMERLGYLVEAERARRELVGSF